MGLRTGTTPLNDSFRAVSKSVFWALLRSAMNISFLCSRIFLFDRKCPSASVMPGEEIDISAELRRIFSFNCRVVQEVPGDRIILVDTCWGGGLKIVSDDCQFVMPTNNDEWEVVKPILKELAERRVLVLSEVSYNPPDLSVIKEECRKSFYSPSDGALINRKFEWDNLTPEKMAEAGLMFVGDATNDATICYCEPSHERRRWRESDTPINQHLRRDQSLCIDNEKYKIPVLSTKDGELIPTQAYKVNMHSERSDHNCDNLILVTHSVAPIKIVPLSEIASKVDAAMLAVVNSSLLENRDLGKAIDSQYFELLKQSITYSHFSGLLKDFQRISYDFITELQSYKTQLHALADLTATDGLLEKLKSRSVLAEVKETVKRLAALELVKENANRLVFLPSATHQGVSSNSELVVRKELQELADSYEQRYFVDDFLNGLVKDGTLGCLFTSDYFNSSKRNERLMSLLARGTEFTQLLVRISEVIRELLEPYMVQQLEPC